MALYEHRERYRHDRDDDNTFSVYGSSVVSSEYPGVAQRYHPYSFYYGQKHNRGKLYHVYERDTHSYPEHSGWESYPYVVPFPRYPYYGSKSVVWEDSDRKSYYKQRREQYRERWDERNTNFCVVITFIVFGLVLLVGLGLGIGLGFTLGDDDKEDTPTTPYVLTYVVDGSCNTDLEDRTSAAYTSLRESVIDSVEPTCDCEITDVIFECGSIKVTVIMAVPGGSDIPRLQQRLREKAIDGSLLPGHVVNQATVNLQREDEIDETEPETTTKLDETTTTTRPTTEEEVVTQPQPTTTQVQPATTAQPTTVERRQTTSAAEATTSRAPTTVRREATTAPKSTTVENVPTTPPTTTAARDPTTVQQTTAVVQELTTTKSTTVGGEPTTTLLRRSTTEEETTTAQIPTTPSAKLTTVLTTTLEDDLTTRPQQTTTEREETTTFEEDLTTDLQRSTTADSQTTLMEVVSTTEQQTTLFKEDTTTDLETTVFEEQTATELHTTVVEEDFTTEFEEISSTGPEETTMWEETTDFMTTEIMVEMTTEATSAARVVEIEAFSGAWLEWGPWSNCSLPCGSGLQSRERECGDGGRCLGVSKQERFCNAIPCPRTVMYALWSPWGQWSDCSDTCGGGERTRERSCAPTGQELYCTGAANQTEACNSHNCPNCSMTCDTGSLDANCTYCECEEMSYEGRVLANRTKLPLQNVTISPYHMPDLVLEITGLDGKFNLTGPCGETRLLFRREDYVDTSLTANSAAAVVTMSKIDPLAIVVNPIDKKRLVGEDVTFCCLATGDPPPKYYEWLKDEEIISIESVTDPTAASSLQLNSLTFDDDGTYSCRASNDYSASFSAVARLVVRDSRDAFCQGFPETRYKALPSGCSIDNQTEIDVGECKRLKCRGETPDSGQCGAGESYCCGPTAYTTIAVNCSSHRVTYNVITACGCQPCLEFNIYIRGEVLEENGNSPVVGAEVWYNDAVVSITDDDGKFSFTVDEELERITMTVTPSMSNDNLAGITQTLSIGKGTDGVFFVTVKLMEKAIADDVDASQEVASAMTSRNTNKAMGELIIPPQSFYTEDGELVEGLVQLSVTSIEPSDEESSALAPGDFSTVDNEGEQQVLSSFGMFTIEARANGSSLQIPGEITLEVTTETVGNETDDDGNSLVKLWSMNPKTGRWDFESNLVPVDESGSGRKKRQLPSGVGYYSTTIKGIPVAGTWYNFDAISDRTCYSKIRVFNSDKTAQIKRATVGVIVTSGFSGNSVTYQRAATDVGDDNGYCVAHPCDNEHRNGDALGFEGRIIADVYRSTVEPLPKSDLSWSGVDLADVLNYETVDDTISVNLNLRVNDNVGPFYNWDRWKWRYSDKCSSATTSENFFQFTVLPINLTDCELASPDPTSTEVFEGDPDTCNADRYLQLYSFSDVISQSVQSCYIKVYTEGTIIDEIIAYSKVGTAFREGYVEPGDIYGSSRNCIQFDFTCLEIKVPGDISCSTVAGDAVNDSYTEINLMPVFNTTLYQDGFVSSFHRLLPVTTEAPPDVPSNATLRYRQEHRNASDSFTFQFTASMTEGHYGIFCETMETVEAARTSAKQACEQSNRDEWAVIFTTCEQDFSKYFYDYCYETNYFLYYYNYGDYWGNEEYYGNQPRPV